MRKSVLAALAALLFAAPVSAAPTASGSLALDPSSDLVFGGAVVLASTTDVPRNLSDDVLTSVYCFQGGTVVYQWSKHLSLFPSPQTFPLVDQEGQGLDWPGGAASCTAQLRVYSQRGKNIEALVLDDVTFEVMA